MRLQITGGVLDAPVAITTVFELSLPDQPIDYFLTAANAEAVLNSWLHARKDESTLRAWEWSEKGQTYITTLLDAGEINGDCWPISVIEMEGSKLREPGFWTSLMPFDFDIEEMS